MRSMGNFRDNRSGGGRNFGRRSFDGNRGGDREMHSAVCSNCGKNCEVPFEPTGSKPVYCFDCFKKMGGGRDSNRSQDRRSESRPQNNEQFDAINRKLDKILEILTVAPVKEKAIISQKKMEISIKKAPVIKE